MVMDAHGDHDADQSGKKAKETKPSLSSGDPQWARRPTARAHRIKNAILAHICLRCSRSPSMYVLISFCFFMFFRARGIVPRFILFLTFQVVN